MTWLELPDITLRFALSGKWAHGLVLIHELGGGLESFDAVVCRLDHRFRILRYDQRGAGLSEKPRERFTLDNHVRDLAGLLAASGLEPPVLLGGVAAGAAIAVAYALARPASVIGLVLCSPALTVPAERRDYLAARSTLAARRGMRAIAEATLDRSHPPALRGDGTTFAAYRARFLANDPVTYGYANMAVVDATLATQLGALRLPCRVLAGRHDLLRPPAPVAAIAERIPGATFAIVESGHLMSVQAPDALEPARTAPYGGSVTARRRAGISRRRSGAVGSGDRPSRANGVRQARGSRGLCSGGWLAARTAAVAFVP